MLDEDRQPSLAQRLLPWLLALACAVLLVAWVAVSPRPPRGVVQLRFGNFGTPEQLAQETAFLREFERTHPGIKVKLEWVSTGNYLLKLKTQIAGGNAPDVTWMGSGVFYEFAAKGAFLPLDEFIANDPQVRREDFYPVMFDAYTFRGKLYGMPKDNTPLVLFYNIDMLEKAGVPLPDGTWTWDDLIRLGKQVTRDLNGDGRLDQFMYLPLWDYLYFYQHGNTIFDPATGRCTLDQPSAIATMQFRRDLVYKHHIAPRPLETATLIASGGAGDAGMGAFDLFPLQRVACLPCNAAVVPYFKRACKFRWDIAKIPRGERDVQLVDGAAYPILAQTRHPREAWELVKFMSGPWVQGERAKAGDSVPSLRAITESPLFLDQPPPPASRAITLTLFDKLRCFPQHERWGAVEQIIGRWFEKILTDERPIPVADGLRQCTAEVNRLLETED